MMRANTSHGAERMTRPRFTRITNVLPVSDIYDTIAWYERVLGLTTRYVHGSGRRGEERNFANYLIMERDGLEFHFILDESGPADTRPRWTRAGSGYLGLTTDDVDALHAEIATTGASTDGPVRQMNWPARGFNLTDPSGNTVHVEQPTG